MVPAVHGEGLDRGRLAFATLAALAAIAAAQLADLTTFLRMISVGGLAAEANPIVVHIEATLGLATLVALKLALIPFLALVFAALARVRQGLAASVLTVGTLAGLVGALTNILTIA